MPYIDPEVIAEVKKMDLFTYLSNYEPHELVRFSGGVYCTRTHDSLKISNGKWDWHSRGIGGRSALDYLIKVNGMSFLEAAAQIAGRAMIKPPVYAPAAEQKPKAEFALPPRDKDCAKVEKYLHNKRGISHDVISYCIDRHILYQTRNGKYANAVFVGHDATGIPRYAGLRGTTGNYQGDAEGSDKRYSFAIPNYSTHLSVFESAIDLLSYATLEDMWLPDDFYNDLLSLSGVYQPKKNIKETILPPALTQYLKDHEKITHIHLHLDNDRTGRLATEAILTILPKKYTVTDEPPTSGKDYNDQLCDHLKLSRTPIRERSHAR